MSLFTQPRSMPGQIPVKLIYSGGLWADMKPHGHIIIYFDDWEKASAFAQAAQQGRDICGVYIGEGIGPEYAIQRST